MDRLKARMENSIAWLTKSGLKINTAKTEICIFHRRNLLVRDVALNDSIVKTSNTINVLGIKFDSRLRWNDHVEMAIKGANVSLFGIRMIKKYFTPAETRNLITAVFFSKLYYGAEVWHFSGLSRNLHKKLKYASANALKICTPGVTNFSTHSEIHRMADRATPEQMCQYRHAVQMYKLVNNVICEDEFVQLNFQMYDNERNQKVTFLKIQRYDVGKNILLNRFYDLNNLIDKQWLEMSLETYKIKCKALFLQTQ